MGLETEDESRWIFRSAQDMPKAPRHEPSGLQEAFKRPKMSRRWSQAKLKMDLGEAKSPPGRSKTAQDGVKSAPKSEEKVESIRTHNLLKTLCFTLFCHVRSFNVGHIGSKLAYF